MNIFFTESWSLPIEEFAYFIGPLLLYILVTAFAKAKKESIFLWVTIGIIIIFLFTKVAYNVRAGATSLDYWNIHLKAVVLYRLDAIYYGVLAAFVSLKYASFWKSKKAVLGALGVFLFLGFQWVLGVYQLSIDRAPFVWNVLYLPLVSISFCLFLPFLSAWGKAPRFIGRPIVMISLISYAIYLLHYGLILQGMRWIQPIDQLSHNERLIFTTLYLVVTMVISYGWYCLFEKPMMDMRDHPRIKKYFKR